MINENENHTGGLVGPGWLLVRLHRPIRSSRVLSEPMGRDDRREYKKAMSFGSLHPQRSREHDDPPLLEILIQLNIAQHFHRVRVFVCVHSVPIYSKMRHTFDFIESLVCLDQLPSSIRLVFFYLFILCLISIAS